MKRNVFYGVFAVFMLVCCLFWFQASPDCIHCNETMNHQEPIAARIWSKICGETFIHYDCVPFWLMENPVEHEKNGKIITNLSISD